MGTDRRIPPVHASFRRKQLCSAPFPTASKTAPAPFLPPLPTRQAARGPQQAEFCNPASGNEKGNVENKVGYSRRNAFVPVPTITSFEAFNQWLWEWCEKDAQRLHYKYKIPIQELWAADQRSLLNLPEHPFPIFRYEAVTVNKYGFATVDTNRYGLSPLLSGRVVQAKIFFDHVEFYYDHKPVGRYVRSYGREQELCGLDAVCWRAAPETRRGGAYPLLSTDAAVMAGPFESGKGKGAEGCPAAAG